MVETTPDEAERFLDLAGFADGRLDADDCERVAEWVAADPIAAGDVGAARTLAASARPESVPELVVARAAALVAGAGFRPANVIPFAPRAHARQWVLGARFCGAARWGSLVAAMAVASWLGFTLGMDTSTTFGQTGQPGESGFLSELLAPSPGLMGDLSQGRRT